MLQGAALWSQASNGRGREHKMPRVSSIRRLDPRIVSEINTLLECGRTLDEILSKLAELGVSDVSRSALGRYKQSYDDVVASVRESRQVAEALVREFGKDSDPKAMRANIEMMQAIISRLAREITRNETLDVKQVAILSGALESLGRASKTDVEMMSKVREQVRREMEAEMRARVQKLGTAQELKELSDAELERRIAALSQRA